MSLLVCSLSGQALSEPVVDRCGHIFEKRVIENELTRSQRCPISGQDLRKEDLLDIAQTPLRRPSSLANDPIDLLDSVKKHIDFLNIENERIARERDECRKEASYLMYVRDGAARVLARKVERIRFLEKELEACRQQWDDEQRRKRARTEEPNAAAGASMAESSMSFEELSAEWDQLSRQLISARKERSVVSRPVEAFKDFVDDGRITTEGMCCFDVMASAGIPQGASTEPHRPYWLACGYGDGSVRVWDWDKKSEICSMTGHSGPVKAICSFLYPSSTHLSVSALAYLKASSASSEPYPSCLMIISGSEDQCVRIWKGQGIHSPLFNRIEDMDFLYEEKDAARYVNLSDKSKVPTSFTFVSESIVKLNRGAIRAIRRHPSGTYAAIVTEDGTWTFLDLISGNAVKVFKLESRVLDLVFQPDGLIAVGITDQNEVAVWNMKTGHLKSLIKSGGLDEEEQQMVGDDSEGEDAAEMAENGGPVELTSVSFSENGYRALITRSDGYLEIWDMRKGFIVLREKVVNGRIEEGRYDYSGKRIIIKTRRNVRLFAHEKKNGLIRIPLPSIPRPGPGGSVYFDHLTDDYIIYSDATSIQTFIALPF